MEMIDTTALMPTKLTYHVVSTFLHILTLVYNPINPLASFLKGFNVSKEERIRL